MKLRKGETEVTFPVWLLALGVLVLDNIAGNICRTIIATRSRKSSEE